MPEEAMPEKAMSDEAVTEKTIVLDGNKNIAMLSMKRHRPAEACARARFECAHPA